MKKNIFLFFLFICLSSCFGQSEKLLYSEVYDLQFKMNADSMASYTWRENAAYHNFTIGLPYFGKDGRPLFTYYHPKGFPFMNKLRAECEQRILLPTNIHNEPNGTIHIESIGKNIEFVSLLIDGFDNKEKLLYSDTLIYQQIDTAFTSASIKFPLTGVELLNFRIHAEGLPQEEAILLKLLDILKAYNTDKEEGEKVCFLGMDYTSQYDDTQNTFVDIFDYLSDLNTYLRVPEIEKLAVLLMDKDRQRTLSFMEKNKKELIKNLSIIDYNCIVHILELSESIGPDPIIRSIKRDSVMFENTRFLISNFAPVDEGVIIYAHFGHINPISTYPAVPCVPFGKYMKKQYPKDYMPLLILIGHAKTLAFDNRYNAQTKVLASPPVESIEYSLSSLRKGDVYMPLTADLDCLLLSRFKGSHHTPQEFFPFNLYRRYEGLFFIEQDWEESGKNIRGMTVEENVRRNIRKVEERNRIYEVLKQRVENK